MNHCIFQWALLSASVIWSYLLGWPAFMTFVAGAIFGTAAVMTAITVSEAKP